MNLHTLRRHVLSIVLAALVPMLLASGPGAQERGRRAERVVLETADGVDVYTDLYLRNPEEEAPLVVLFPDTRQSMAEYKTIAPRLCRLGFNCLAVDTRAGNLGPGSKSLTAQHAGTRNRTAKDAMFDFVAALEWARSEHPKRIVVALGCEYSAGMVLRLAATRPDLVDAVAAFSPAETFAAHGESDTWLLESAPLVSCPVWITSAAAEEKEWRAISEALPDELAHEFLPAGRGTSGVQSLGDGAPGSEEVWTALFEFLEQDVVAHVARARGEPGAPEHVLDRTWVVGASLTCGVFSEVDLAAVLTATVRREAILVERRCSALFFGDPVGKGTEFLSDARAADPTLLVAIDFLFWFGYGNRRLDGRPLALASERLELLEAGLELLEGFDCPIVVGDFPNMEAAVGELAQGKLLHATQLPSPEELALLNARLREYAAEHPNVLVFPLADVHARMRSDEAVTLGRHSWPAKSYDRLMLADDLHPTLEGRAAVVHAIAVMLFERGLVAEEDLVLDLDQVLATWDVPVEEE